MHPYTKGIYLILKKRGNKADAILMKKYMRDQFEFFGIRSVQRRELCKAYLNTQPIHDWTAIKVIVKELWSLPERELHYFAIELLMKFKKKWTSEDVVFFEYLIVHHSWWDTIDTLAGYVVGPWFMIFPDATKQITGKWNNSKNIWLQRMSILFQLKYKKQTDLNLLNAHILNLIGSKEFFVQKAIGWMLREYSKTDPLFVSEYVTTTPLMPLSKREALKIIERKTVR